MGKGLEHQEIARKLAKTMAEKQIKWSLEDYTKKQCFNSSFQWIKVNYLSSCCMDN